MKENTLTPPLPLNESTYFVSGKGEMMDILKICSKNVYKEFCSYKTTSPTAQAKLEGKYPSFWGERTKIYSLPLRLLWKQN